MDQEHFQATARELLEQHIAETEPTRPEGNYGRLAQGTGSYVSETRAAEHNNRLVNGEYFEHQSAKGSEQRQDARAALDAHIQETHADTTHSLSAQEALMQHLEGAKHEITSPVVDPHQRARQDLEHER